MITEEQIKNLKPGDIIYLNNYPLTFQTSNIHGHVFAHDNVAECGEGCACWFSNKYLSLTGAETAPKYDPCRKFKEGDIVDYRRVCGRDYETVPDPGDYKLARVISSEDDEDGMVGVEFVAAYGGEDVYFAVPWFHLELVIPVEELNPYSIIVQPEGYHCVRIMKETKIHSSIPFDEEECVYRTLEEAKAAAEAECERLNSEYRKEQNNG